MKRLILLGYITGSLFVSCNAVIGFAQQKIDPGYILINNLSYLPNDTLKADFYLPVNYKKQKNPVLVFIDGLGSDFRKWDHYRAWAQFAAGEGFVSVIYSSRKNYATQSFDGLLNFIASGVDTYFTDLNRVAVYAGSGNVMLGLPLANSDTRIKAALIYYGTARMESFRPDLPVLLVRAGLDNVQLNKDLDSLAFKALTANAPYTITNFNTAVHAFEDFTTNRISKQFVKSSLNFLRENMLDLVQEDLSKHTMEIIAMRELYRANWTAALEAYRKVLQKDSANNEAERQLGNISIELKNYETALLYYNNALAHGNWRKGEIARQKLLAYTKLDNIDAAVMEMHILNKIGWFKESDYAGKEAYINIIKSEAYKKFITGH
ncbi:MAG: dienelactone hydrolase family protein [Ferruginibacter sp.]|nr:dienelactone hydrolase family protein [Chitinophagaceae bacterium]